LGKWEVIVNDESYSITFEGCKVSGKASLKINDSPVLLSPTVVKGIGIFYLFEIGDSEFILKLDLNNQPAGLAREGVYLETGLPIEEEAITALRESIYASQSQAQKERARMGSFLTFVGLTYLNLILIAVDASISFPFSAFVPQIIMGFGLYGELPISPVIMVLAAIAIASVYLGLYLLARKWTWPILVTIILIILDTIVIVFFAVDDFSSYIIDLAFHAWVVWSLAKLLAFRAKTAEPVMEA
jgi:hypothetical protein